MGEITIRCLPYNIFDWFFVVVVALVVARVLELNFSASRSYFVLFVALKRFLNSIFEDFLFCGIRKREAVNRISDRLIYQIFLLLYFWFFVFSSERFGQLFVSGFWCAIVSFFRVLRPVWGFW